MELSAAGFRGREKPSVGFWFWVPAITLTLMLANQLKENVDDEVDESTVHVTRNFYGVLRVRFEAAPDFEDDGGGESRTVERSRNSLTHGQIKHGFQFREEDWKRTPTTYYGRKSGIGLAIANRREAAKSEGRGVRVGVVGLGTGTIAAYGEKGDYFRFYDINPDVRKLSDDGIFTYLSDSPAEKDVAIGDARIVMERELNGMRVSSLMFWQLMPSAAMQFPCTCSPANAVRSTSNIFARGDSCGPHLESISEPQPGNPRHG